MAKSARERDRSINRVERPRRTRTHERNTCCSASCRRSAAGIHYSDDFTKSSPNRLNNDC